MNWIGENKAKDSILPFKKKSNRALINFNQSYIKPIVS